VSVPTLKKSDDGIYYVHWTDAGRSKRVSTRSRDLAAAKSFLGTWLLMERSAPSGKESLTVADCWTLYDKQHIRKNVAAPKLSDGAWKNLKPHFADLRAVALTQDDFDGYEAKRIAGKIGRPSKPVTVRTELARLVAALNHCKIPNELRLPAQGTPRDRWLKTDEIDRLMKAAAAKRSADGKLSRAERFLWVALETAGRRQAVLELTWDRVDFDTGVIHLAVPGRMETKKRRASVPISPALRKILQRALIERDKKNPLVVGGVVANKMVKAVAKDAKVQDVSPHVLRHTAATNMARRGVPLWIIAKVLGNTVAMVERVYAKHCPDDLRAAVGLISGALEAAE
jgi:integrase